MEKLRSAKLRADFSLPILLKNNLTSLRFPLNLSPYQRHLSGADFSDAMGPIVGDVRPTQVTVPQKGGRQKGIGLRLGWPATDWETGPGQKVAGKMAGSHLSGSQNGQTNGQTGRKSPNFSWPAIGPAIFRPSWNTPEKFCSRQKGNQKREKGNQKVAKNERLPKSDRKREKGLPKSGHRQVTEKGSEWPTPFCPPSCGTLNKGRKYLPEKKGALSPLEFLEFAPVIFFLSFLQLVCVVAVTEHNPERRFSELSILCVFSYSIF